MSALRRAPALLGPALVWATLSGQSLPLTIITFVGGSADDQAFAASAAALPRGQRLDETALAEARRAIEATDRFRRVILEPVRDGEGLRVTITLDPWPRLRRIHLEGVPAGFPRLLPSDLRIGAIAGPRRLEEASGRMAEVLAEAGFPEARVELRRENQDRDLRVIVRPGMPTLIRRVAVQGALGPYREAQLVRWMELEVGQTRWQDVFRMGAESRLRQRFVKDDFLEGHAELDFQPGDGTLSVRLNLGPKVRLRKEGYGLTLRRIRQVLPLTRSDRYTSDLLSEGDRRILRILRAEGHLDARVHHRREVSRGRPEAPEEVTVTYVLEPGQAYVLDEVRFEGNQDLAPHILAEEAGILKTWRLLGEPSCTPDLLGSIEDRIRETYWSRGYPDVTVQRAPVEKAGQRAVAVFRIREGSRQFLQQFALDLPASVAKPEGLAAALLASFMEDPDSPKRLPVRLRSDRPGSRVAATLAEAPSPGPGLRRFQLTFEERQPLIRTEVARVLNLLRQRLLSLGYPRAEMTLARESEGEGSLLRIVIQPGAQAEVRRLVIQGADTLRAKAALRESAVAPGTPLDPGLLAQTQSGLGSLGALQHVDMGPLSEADPKGPWKEGDLVSRLQERSPWVISQAFGYDKSQGYHLGLGVQRANLHGMGRALDLGIRAGDGTIGNPFLRKVFPTGPNPRSVDMYSLAYSDPWFDAFGSLLPDRTQFRLEGAYVLEQRDTYLIRRRRFQNSLEWRPGGERGEWQIQAGLRYERVHVRSAIEGIQDWELNAAVHMPSQATIAAPWFQFLRDRRDNPMDTTRGSFFRARFEFANQLWGTSRNASFVKIDVSQRWHWPLGPQAQAGVASLALRVGAARPTDASARDLPLSERFFAGGPFSHRGVEPDWLGPQGSLQMRDTTPPYAPRLNPDGSRLMQSFPLGGQGLVLASLEVRTPLPFKKRAIWAEFFVDSGQVYKSLFEVPGEPRFPALRTSVGAGLILKVGLPLKVEYAWDLKRILGRPRTAEERATQLRNVLLSAGYQF